MRIDVKGRGAKIDVFRMLSFEDGCQSWEVILAQSVDKKYIEVNKGGWFSYGIRKLHRKCKTKKRGYGLLLRFST